MFAVSLACVPWAYTPPMDRFRRDFGDRVRLLREQRGLSQDRLAADAGLHKNYVGAVERGAYNVTLKTAYRLAQALGVPLTDLVGEDQPAAPESEAEALRLQIASHLRRQGVAKLRTVLAVVKELTRGR